MIKLKVTLLAIFLSIAVISVLATGLLASDKSSLDDEVIAIEMNKTKYISELTSENIEERERAAESIRIDHKELIKLLLQLASKNVEPLSSSDQLFPAVYPWHDSKHLSILLLGDLRAIEAVPILLENLEYINPKTLSGTIPKMLAYPAAEALSKIGMPAVDPTIKKLNEYESNSEGSNTCCWILQKILGVKLAKARIQIAIDETKEENIKKNLQNALSFIETRYGNAR